MRKEIKQVFITTGLISIISLVVALDVFATCSIPSPSKQSRHWGKDIVQRLNLSPQQKKEIEHQRTINRQKWAELRQKIYAKRMELREELDKSATDRKKMDSITTEIKALQSEELDLHINNLLAMKQILTPEQFKELNKKGFKRKFLPKFNPSN